MKSVPTVVLVLCLLGTTFAQDASNNTTEHTICPEDSEPQVPSTNIQQQGEVIVIDGLPLYTVGTGRTAVIVLYDIYGFDSGRIRPICDQIAEAGFSVVMPDIFRGDPWTPDRTDDMLEWLKTFTPTAIKADLEIVYGYLEGKGISKIGAIGFCWGGFAVFQAASMGKIVAGVACHPSISLGARLFNLPDNQQAEAVQCPQLLLPAGNDPDNLKPGGEIQKIFDTKPWGNLCLYHCFTEMNHGFVVRGDISVPAIARDVKLAMDISIDFLNKLVNS